MVGLHLHEALHEPRLRHLARGPRLRACGPQCSQRQSLFFLPGWDTLTQTMEGSGRAPVLLTEGGAGWGLAGFHSARPVAWRGAFGNVRGRRGSSHHIGLQEHTGFWGIFRTHPAYALPQHSQQAACHAHLTDANHPGRSTQQHAQ